MPVSARRIPTFEEPVSWQSGWSQAVEEFVASLELRGYSVYTLRDYRTDVMRLGATVDVVPSKLTAEHVREAGQLLEEEGLKRSARRRRLSAYHRFLAFLHDREEGRPTAPDMMARVREQRPCDQLLVGLVYLAGLRLVEIIRLEGRDIRLRREVLVTRSGYRIVPLHPFLTRLFESLKDHAPLAAYRPVVPGPNGFPVNARTLHSRFQRLAARVGVTAVKPEDLRREAAEHLRHHGAPPGLVYAFLGKDRGRPLAPRRSGNVDLTCLRPRIETLPTEPPTSAGKAAGT